jgi:hypothetical protein
MYCPNCGTALPENARACSTCGVQFAPPLIGPLPVQAPAQTPVEQPATVQPSQETQPYATQPIPAQPQQPYASQPVPTQSQSQYAPQPGQLIPRKKRTGLIVAVVVGGVVLIGAGVAAAMILLPSMNKPAPPKVQMPPAYAPMPVDLSFEETRSGAVDATGTIDTGDNTAAENAVVTFYETVNSGDFTAVQALVTPDTKSAIDPGAFEGWSTTTFEVTWSAVDSGTAYVYGRESVRQFGSQDLGVKFTLQRQNGEWLIQTWTGVDEATVNGATPSSGKGSGATALTAASAKDIVSSLLQARQAGDSQTVRMLTTAKFQTDHGDIWLDGSDNSEYFTKYTIKTAKKKGSTYVVTVTEVWNSGTETGTYTVVQQSGVVLVNDWSSR